MCDDPNNSCVRRLYNTTVKDVLHVLYKVTENYFTGLISRIMFDFAISAGSKQKESKKDNYKQKIS